MVSKNKLYLPFYCKYTSGYAGSKNDEPFKFWLAKIGNYRINAVFDFEKAEKLLENV